MKKTIVIVDDAATNLAIAKEVLQAHFTVFAVLSVEKMFKIIERRVPHLILLDIEMPVTNGFEAIKMLKQAPRFAPIPVIFLTSHGDDTTRAKCFELGAANFISKPFSPQELLEKTSRSAI